MKWSSEASLMRCGLPSRMACAVALRIAQELMVLAAMLPQGASPVVVAQVRRRSSLLRLNLRAEAVQLPEPARASSANSAGVDLIMAEDLEEDTAAAAVVAAAAMEVMAATAAETTAVTAAETTTRATTSSTWRTATARPGTAPATDAS